MRSNKMDTRPVSPWWRHGMVWLVISGPAAAIVAGIATLVIAITHPDPVLKTTEAPAVQARNHVVTPAR
jgi:uncharacterized protein